jgi:hypothetical protein
MLMGGTYTLGKIIGSSAALEPTFDPVPEGFTRTNLSPPGSPGYDLGYRMVLDVDPTTGTRVLRYPYGATQEVTPTGDIIYSQPSAGLAVLNKSGDGVLYVRGKDADTGEATLSPIAITSGSFVTSVPGAGWRVTRPLPEDFYEITDYAGDNMTRTVGKYVSVEVGSQPTWVFQPTFTSIGKLEATATGTAIEVIGTITDTPDGAGGINRVVSTMVDGKLVEITQHVDATKAGVDSDLDGNMVDAGDAVTTDLNIGGEDAVNSDLIEDAIDANYVSAIDIIRARGTGDLRQLMTAGDPNNSTGIYTVSTPPGTAPGTPWYNTPGAQHFGSYLSGVQSFVAGFESGDYRIIATTLVNMFAPGSNLAGGLNGVSNLLSLKAAWERGDGVRVLLSGISVANDVLKAYALILKWQEAVIREATAHLTEAAVKEALADVLAEQTALGVFAENFGKVIPYLGALIKLDEGEYLDAAILAVAAYFKMATPVGWIVAFVDIWEAMGTDTIPRGIATVVASGTDGLDTAIEPSGNNFGGATVAVEHMAALLNLLRSDADKIPNHGVVAERVPVLEMNGETWTLRVTDPDTGAQTLRDFDKNGKMIGETVDGVWLEVAGTENFHVNLPTQFMQLAAQLRAYAPDWELATIYQQHQRNLPQAGMTTLRRAKEDDTLLTGTSGTNQAVRPIVLDFGDDGSPMSERALGGGVPFDVDDDGFVELSTWINPRDGMLALDRDGDGHMDIGHELFTDAGVNTAVRGLNVLKEIDANGDELITSLDPTINSFVMSGATRPMALATLTADTQGVMTQLVDGGVAVRKTCRRSTRTRHHFVPHRALATAMRT